MAPEQATAIENELCRRRGDARRERDKAAQLVERLKVQLATVQAELTEAEQDLPVAERLVEEAEQELARFRESQTQEARLAAATAVKIEAVQFAQQRAPAAAQAAARAREEEIRAQAALAVALTGGDDQ